MPFTLEFTLQPDDGIYARRLYGQERFSALMTCVQLSFQFPAVFDSQPVSSERINAGHIFVGTHVKFKSQNLLLDVLVKLVKTSWVRTRFMTPWIATITARSPNTKEGDNAWIQSYESFSDVQLAEKWASITVIRRNDTITLAEWEEIIKQESWKPSDGRYGVELNIARAPSGGYFIM